MEYSDPLHRTAGQRLAEVGAVLAHCAARYGGAAVCGNAARAAVNQS